MYQQNNDPWAWLNEQKQVAPMQNTFAPLAGSQEQPPPPQVTKDPTAQYFNQYALGKGVNMAEKGVTSTGKTLFGSQAPAPVVNASAAIPATGAIAPLGVTPATATALEGATIGADAAMASEAAGLAAAAPAAATLGTEAAAATAATNAWNPVGWAAAAYLGGKALKLW